MKTRVKTMTRRRVNERERTMVTEAFGLLRAFYRNNAERGKWPSSELAMTLCDVDQLQQRTLEALDLGGAP